MLPIEESRRRGAAEGLDSQFADLSVFRMLLHNPPVARELAKTLTTLLFDGNVLNARLRELVIMRIGWVTGSQYEWTQHWRVARGMDIPADDLLAVRNWRGAANLTAADKAVLQAADDTLEQGCIQPDTWAECCEHLATEAERVELVVAIGNWSLFSQLLRSLQVPLEEGVEAWPPDGQAGQPRRSA
jgi:alkylhydroperoxidase family enzyme